MAKRLPIRLLTVPWLLVCAAVAGCTTHTLSTGGSNLRGTETPDARRQRLQRDDTIRRALVRAAETGQGTITAERTSISPEGDPVMTTLRVDRGRITLTRDFSRDKTMPLSKRMFLQKFMLNALRLGYLDEFHMLRPPENAPPGTGLVIEYELPGAGMSYF